jgi:hypothetical protein
VKAVPSRPWEGEHACTCGGAGASCPKCNVPEKDEAPRAAGFQDRFRVGAISGRGWKRPFDDPIPLPRGRQLIILEDAGAYITELPKAEQQLDEWQAAAEALLLVVKYNGRP